MSRGVFGQSVVRLRAGVKIDRAGNRTADWTNPEREPIGNLSVQPNAQAETFDGVGDRRVTGYRVITRPGTTPDITALDRIEYGRDTYLVDGEVATWPDPFGRDHIEFAMKLVKGA